MIHWTETDINNIQRKTHKILTNARFHHPKAAIERLYLPRTKGGRGLIDLKSLMNKQKILLREYFIDKQHTSKLHHIIVQSDDRYTVLDLAHEIDFPRTSHEETLQKWREKTLHGKHIYELSQPHIDTEASNAWLIKGHLFPETEGFATPPTSS